MAWKLLKTFDSSSPVETRVVFVPDSFFFVRRISVVPGSAEEIASQVELALEGLSPFPLPQLLYGYFLPGGSDQALVFAAYRKRFSAEEVAGWGAADYVLPAFAAALGFRPEAPGPVLVSHAHGVTAVLWDGSAVPSGVVSRALPPETDAAGRRGAAEELAARQAGAAGELPAPLEPTAEVRLGKGGEDVVFALRRGGSGDAVESHLPVGLAEAMDVREKEQLAARRREQARNRLLWRGFVGAIAALIIACLAEIGLLVGGFMLEARQRTVEARAPQVQAVMTADTLANRIEELGTKRLLPFEMLDAINEARPQSISFTRVSTNGLYVLEVSGEAQNPLDVENYRAQLSNLSGVSQVEIIRHQGREGRATFTLAVTFQPGALQSEAASIGGGEEEAES